MANAWTFSFSYLASLGSGTTLPVGYYYLKITNTADDSTTLIHYSEPIWIKTSHDKTLLAEYYLNESYKDIIIEWPIAIKFSIRFEGDIRQLKPMHNLVSYQDQQFQQYNLSSQAWRTFLLKIGGKNGVPAYIVDKLKDVLIADYITIDGKPFELNNDNGGASSSAASIISINDSDTSPLVTAQATIRYTNETDAITTISHVVTLSPTLAFPCAMTQFAIARPGITLPRILTDGRIFNSSSDVTTYVAYLNNTVALLAGFKGTFIYSGGVISYQAAVTENVGSYINTFFTSHFDLNITVGAGTNKLFQYNFTGGQQIADWGDSTFNWYRTGATNGTHTYTSASTFKLRIFSDDNITSLTFNYSSSNTYIVALLSSSGSTAPANLQTLYVINQNISAASIDPTFLQNCNTTLTTLKLLSCGITGFSPALFVGTGAKFKKMIYLDLANNALATSTVDSVFENLYLSVFGASTVGYARTQYQTPTAPPTSASSTQRTALIHAAWTILTD
jgi:hypothetical protein